MASPPFWLLRSKPWSLQNYVPNPIAPYDPAAIHASYSKNLNTFENITSLLKTQQRLLISQSKAKLLKTAYKALHDLLPT